MEKLTKPVRFWLCATIIILGLIGCDRFIPTSGDAVERVSDGDTLVVKDADGKNFSVRFACIDA
ncbi:MAG: thermonuclease family protein, partial [Nostoc sp.]